MLVLLQNEDNWVELGCTLLTLSPFADDNIDETYGVNVQFESDEEVSDASKVVAELSLFFVLLVVDRAWVRRELEFGSTSAMLASKAEPGRKVRPCFLALEGFVNYCTKLYCFSQKCV